MPSLEISAETQHRLERSHYLVAYLAKLYDEHSTEEGFTVPVTVRKGGTSGLVVGVDGHDIEFSA